jgi:hypothetical protein
MCFFGMCVINMSLFQLQLSEWLSRSACKLPDGENWTVIGVKKHKTATQQVATILLDEEEDAVSIFTTICYCECD